jgi:hypothetical protein
MDFDTKAFKNSCHLSNESSFLINLFFQQTYVHLTENLVQMYFVKSHESKFSNATEMVQSIHIQYMTKYFKNFWKQYNHFSKIIALSSIS